MVDVANCSHLSMFVSSVWYSVQFLMGSFSYYYHLLHLMIFLQTPWIWIISRGSRDRTNIHNKNCSYKYSIRWSRQNKNKQDLVFKKTFYYSWMSEEENMIEFDRRMYWIIAVFAKVTRFIGTSCLAALNRVVKIAHSVHTHIQTHRVFILRPWL